MSYNTQCTQAVFGALGSGASGSSTMSAKLLVPAGAPLHSRGGARSLPSQVYSLGMSPFGANAGDVSESVMGAPGISEDVHNLPAADPRQETRSRCLALSL